MSTSLLHDFRIAADGIAYALPDGRTLFDGISLGFGREKTGLVGPNGAGKTTLARVLAGELAPSSGTVLRRGAVGYLPQGFAPRGDDSLAALLGIEDRLAALERVLAGSAEPADFDAVGDDGWDLAERAAALLARFGLQHLPLDRPAAGLSGGEATRAALAGLMLGGSRFLVLDEPTNHLDADARGALYELVRGWTGGLLVISHDRALLGLVDRIVELSGLGARIYGGHYEAYRAQKDAEEAAAARELASARHALDHARREAERIRERQARRDARGKRSRATTNTAPILLGMQKERSEGTGGRVREVTARLVEDGRERVRAARERVDERGRLALALPPTGLWAGKTVLEMEGVGFSYPGASRPLIDSFHLRIDGPERVAVVGPNGSGKSTLLRLVAGHLHPSAGTIRVGVSEEEVAFFDQHAAGLDAGRTVLEAYRAAHPEMDETESRTALARFLFVGEDARKAAGDLSGGERLRLALACAVGGTRPPSLLLLDEPTNHLDLDSVRALESILAGYDGALLVVSHDAAFLEAIGIQRGVHLSG